MKQCARLDGLFADVDNRWGGLVVGLMVAAVLGQIPIVGGLTNFVIVVLGLGALVVELVSRRQRMTETTEERVEGSPMD